jgi:hypothetical protein
VGSRECGSENSGFTKRWGRRIYEERFVSQEGLCSLELVNFAMGSSFFTEFILTLLSKQKNAPMYQALLLQKAATNFRLSAL